MKKIFAFLLSIVIVLSFTACTSESDIIGLWRLEGEDSMIYYQAFEFDEGGTGTGATLAAFQDEPSITNITWELDGDTVIFVYEGESTKHELKLNSDKTKLINTKNSDQKYAKQSGEE